LSTVSTVTLPVNMALFNVCPHMLMRGIPAAIYSNSEARYYAFDTLSHISNYKPISSHLYIIIMYSLQSKN